MMKVANIFGTGKKKKLVAMGLTIVMLVGNVTSVAFAATSSNTGSSAVSLLSAIGIISADSSGTYNLNKTLTRAEYAKMLVDGSSYKNQVTSGVLTSTFKDVARTNWAASYIKLAAAKGLLSGYSDGNYKPDSYVTFEQGVNSALVLLGYTQSDFTGAFPYAQINMAESLGLTDNMSCVIGGAMTKNDAVNLIYNTLNAYVKDSEQKYAEELGYTVNSNGSINYASALTSNMSGPVTVESTSWYTTLGMTSSGMIVYKNGSLVSLSDINTNDIVYYSKSMNTAWAYSNKITGIYESAEPNQDAPESVVVSGTTYELEGSAAFSALASGGDIKIGDAVTLLLGKDGDIADAVSTDEENETVSIYVTETGSKVYEDSDGNSNTSTYIAGVTGSGYEVEYAVNVTWVEVGDMVTISFNDDEMSVSATNTGKNITGLVDADLMQIGTADIATNARIIDTYTGTYTKISLSRLDGLQISKEDILYSKAENGEITELILDNATGDAASYGVVLSSSSSSSSSSMSASGSYTYDIGGIEATLSTQSKSIRISKGPAMFYGSEGNIESMKNLTSIGNRITKTTSTYVVAGGVTYPYSANVLVYEKDSEGDYKISTMAKMIASESSTSFYYDKVPSDGGRIRVIVY